VQSWFNDPEQRASRRIDFDKAIQLFDASATERLLNLVDPHGFTYTPRPIERPERLESNLLAITRVPDLFYSVPFSGHAGQVVAALREHGAVRLDWVRFGGRLYTLLPVEEIGLSGLAEGPTDAHAREEWLAGDDVNKHRFYVRLLKAALRQYCIADLLMHRDRGYLYFMATEKLRTRNILCSSTGHAHQVFYGHFSRNANRVNYYIHLGLDPQFLIIEGAWYCALSPTWHFTKDGYRELSYSAELVAGRKRQEKNLGMRGHVRTWASYLRREDGLINSDLDDALAFGELVTFDVALGIDDKAWTSARPKKSRLPAYGQLDLFGNAS